MTTATVTATSLSAEAGAKRPRKPRLGLLDIIATFGAALDAKHTYEELLEKGVEPAEAARRTLLAK